MPTEYSPEHKRQAKAAALIAPSLDAASALLAEAWDTHKPPSKSTLSRWQNDPSVGPDMDWIAGIQVQRVESIRHGVMEMWSRTKQRYMEELPEMSWRDVQNAQFALGILADKVLGRPGAPTVNVDASVGKGSQTYVSVIRRGTEEPNHPRAEPAGDVSTPNFIDLIGETVHD